MNQGARGLESMSRRESIARLAKASVVRVVLPTDRLPAIVPVCAAVRGEAVVFRTGRETLLARTAGADVAVQADHIDLNARTGWTVVARGRLEEVTHPQECAVIHGLVEPLVPGSSNVCLRLPLTDVSGRRIVASGVTPARPADRKALHAAAEHGTGGGGNFPRP
jgi:uncharacterized protein